MRSDVEEIADPQLANTLKKHRIAIEGKDHETTIDGKDRPRRIATRRAILEPRDQDPNGIERVLGTSDLCSINFLERGLRAAASVARLRVRLRDGSGEWFGTGFLVAPNLLMTNHHVLPSSDAASLAVSEFNYQHDLNGVESLRRVYNLMPSTLFFTDAGLDVTLVDVAPRAFDGTPLSEFGFLPLIARSGKSVDGEFVSMIQHPGGQPKQISIRDSQVLIPSPEDVEEINLEKFIHYSTDFRTRVLRIAGVQRSMASSRPASSGGARLQRAASAIGARRQNDLDQGDGRRGEGLGCERRGSYQRHLCDAG